MKTIEVNNVTKKFRVYQPSITKRSTKEIVALQDVSFTVHSKEMIGIIGLNGSGKTTLLKIIAGIYLPDCGTVKTTGKIAPILRLGTGFQQEFTAIENVITYGMLLGLGKEEIKKRFSKIIKFAELEDFVEMPLKHYSTGMKARLAFATSLQIDPDILLVDEILSVGDKNFKEKSFNAFLDFKNSGKTILYASHSLGIMPKICDRIALLDKGKLISIGDPQETIDKYNEITKN